MQVEMITILWDIIYSICQMSTLSMNKTCTSRYKISLKLNCMNYTQDNRVNEVGIYAYLSGES